MPIIKLSSSLNKQIVRQTFHRCLEIILEPIQKLSETGINLLINNKYVWFYPKVSTIIADWPEAATFCLTYKSTNSKYPCHFCLVSRDDLANTMLSEHNLEFRNHKNIRNYYNNSDEKSVCIKSVQNIFWKFK